MVKCSHLNKLFSRYISRIRISGSWICSYLLFRKFTYFSYSTPRLLYSTLSRNPTSNLPLYIRTVISQTHFKGFSVLCRESFIIHFYLCSQTLKIFCIKNYVRVHVEGRGIGKDMLPIVVLLWYTTRKKRCTCYFSSFKCLSDL